MPAGGHRSRRAVRRGGRGRGAPMSESPRSPEPVAPRRYDRYRLWAPKADAVTIRLDGAEHAMQPGAGGWFELPGVPARRGERYAFRREATQMWIPPARPLPPQDG